MKYFILGAIALYQKSFSPDHGLLKGLYPYGFCRFYPSCSEYALGAVEKFGPIVGTYLAAVRLVSCNPFSHPGHRPVLNKISIHQS